MITFNEILMISFNLYSNIRLRGIPEPTSDHLIENFTLENGFVRTSQSMYHDERVLILVIEKIKWNTKISFSCVDSWCFRFSVSKYEYSGINESFPEAKNTATDSDDYELLIPIKSEFPLFFAIFSLVNNKLGGGVGNIEKISKLKQFKKYQTVTNFIQKIMSGEIEEDGSGKEDILKKVKL